MKQREKPPSSRPSFFVWTYRDRRKHGYHLDADEQSSRKLRAVVVSLMEGREPRVSIPLGQPPVRVTAGPRLGKSPKAFKRLVLHRSIDNASSEEMPRIVARGPDLLIELSSEQCLSFVEAIDAYLAGDWDFTFGELSFWPYTRWEK